MRLRRWWAQKLAQSLLAVLGWDRLKLGTARRADGKAGMVVAISGMTDPSNVETAFPLFYIVYDDEESRKFLDLVKEAYRAKDWTEVGPDETAHEALERRGWT